MPTSNEFKSAQIDENTNHIRNTVNLEKLLGIVTP